VITHCTVLFSIAYGGFGPLRINQLDDKVRSLGAERVAQACGLSPPANTEKNGIKHQKRRFIWEEYVEDGAWAHDCGHRARVTCSIGFTNMMKASVANKDPSTLSVCGISPLLRPAPTSLGFHRVIKTA